jgi:hypothetical protein
MVVAIGVRCLGEGGGRGGRRGTVLRGLVSCVE